MSLRRNVTFVALLAALSGPAISGFADDRVPKGTQAKDSATKAEGGDAKQTEKPRLGNAEPEPATDLSAIAPTVIGTVRVANCGPLSWTREARQPDVAGDPGGFDPADKPFEVRAFATSGDRVRIEVPGYDARWVAWADQADLAPIVSADVRVEVGEHGASYTIRAGTLAEVEPDRDGFYALDLEPFELELDIEPRIPAASIGKVAAPSAFPPMWEWVAGEHRVDAGTRILATPGDTATTLARFPEDRTVELLETRGEHAMVRIIDGAVIEGWVDAGRLHENEYFGGFGFGGTGGWGRGGGRIVWVRLDVGTPLHAGPDGAQVGVVTREANFVQEGEAEGWTEVETMTSCWGSVRSWAPTKAIHAVTDD